MVAPVPKTLQWLSLGSLCTIAIHVGLANWQHYQYPRLHFPQVQIDQPMFGPPPTHRAGLKPHVVLVQMGPLKNSEGSLPHLVLMQMGLWNDHEKSIWWCLPGVLLFIY